MNILALDPAAKCGFAHSNGQRGVWQLTGTADEHAGKRLVRLAEHIEWVRRNWGLDKLAFEDASFGSPNPAVQAMHNELRGVIKRAAAEYGIAFVAYKPTSIKAFATGKGNAKKDQMVRAAATMLGVKTEDDNVADASFVLAMAEQGYQVVSKAKREKAIRVASRKAPRLF